MPIGFVLLVLFGGAVVWYIGSKMFGYIGGKVEGKQKEFKDKFTKKD
jgi:hypothetical protein